MNQLEVFLQINIQLKNDFMNTCTQCILPESHPESHFSNGVCSLCQNFGTSRLSGLKVKGENALKELLLSKKTDKYDCIIGLSGGKDSSYILYYVVKKLNINPLAVFFNNGMVVEDALTNVKDMCKLLSVDLVTGYASKYRKRLIKKALLLSKLRKKQVSFCVNCENNIRSLVLNQAKKHNVPFIIWGATEYEDATSSYSSENKTAFRDDFVRRKSNLQKMIAKAKNFFHSGMSFPKMAIITYHHSLYRTYTILDNIKQKAPIGWRVLDPKAGVSFENNYTQVVYFFDYIEYDPIYMINTLKREINWKAPEGKESRMDCKLHTISNYLHWKRTNITKDGYGMAALIRSGKMTREEALKREKLLQNGLKEAAEKCAAELGISGFTHVL
jgi:predicted PP-loop superfamily ATPase